MSITDRENVQRGRCLAGKEDKCLLREQKNRSIIGQSPQVAKIDGIERKEQRSEEKDNPDLEGE